MAEQDSSRTSDLVTRYVIRVLAVSCLVIAIVIVLDANGVHVPVVASALASGGLVGVLGNP